MSDPFWAVLDTLGGQSAARYDWDLALCQWKTYPVFRQHFLQLTSHVASAVDCPTPCDFGCPRRVIHHSAEEIMGLCDERWAPKVALTRPQLSIYRLNRPAIGKALAMALGITDRLTDLPKIPHTLRLGDFNAPTHECFPVILTFEDDRIALTHGIQALCLTYTARFILLAPTREHLSEEAEEQLTARGSLFLAMDELVTLADNGQFRLKQGGSPFRALLPDHYAEPGDSLPANIFRQRGDQWEIRFQGGEIINLQRQDGLEYIAMLLASPGKALSVLDIYHLGKLDDEQRAMALGGGIAVGDRRAIEDYQSALREIDEELQGAGDENDLHRLEELRGQKEWLLDEVSNMKGPGGLLRYAHDPLRRPRDNVRKAIQRTLKGLVENHMTDLAAHLQPMATIRGSAITYQPTEPTSWETRPVVG
jgi:hypothetical protein